MSHRFRIALLGGFEVSDPSGVALRLATRKAQALLGYLGSRVGVEFERDKLAALLWGDREDDRARNSLRQTLFQLRRVTDRPGPQLLNITAHTASLNPAAVQVDVRAFELSAKSTLPGDLQEAAELYRGDLLDGLTVDEAPFDEWLLQERERLREVVTDALGRLLRLQRAEGHMDAAIRTCRRLLLLEPWQEPVHRTLMRLLIDTGQTGAALRQFQYCAEILRRDLGVEPEPQTRRVSEEIRRRHEGTDDRLAEPAGQPGREVLLAAAKPGAPRPPSPAAVALANVRDFQQTLSRQIVSLNRQYAKALTDMQRREATLLVNKPIEGRAWRRVAGLPPDTPRQE